MADLFVASTTTRRRTHPILGEPLAKTTSRASANHQARQSENQLKRIHTAQSDGPVLSEIDGHYEMLVEHPFDSTIKRMSTVWQFIPENVNEDPSDYDLVVYVKGAVERILDRCTHVGIGDDNLPLTEQRREDILQHMNTLAAEGLRVLCLAAKYVPNSEKVEIRTMSRDMLEKDCCFLGLAGI
jgi:Na+-exporting ATPase